MKRQPRPCGAIEAAARARSLAGHGGQYVYGTGDYRPRHEGTKYVDVPWTTRNRLLGSDCAGFAICWAYKLVRRRMGFNAGKLASITDDLNCNSVGEDAAATGEHDLGEAITRPELGALLMYPTFSLPSRARPWIGHVAIIVSVARVLEWDEAHPDWSLVDVAQCCGPEKRQPAVILSTGKHWNEHDAQWPLEAHRSRLVRMLG